MTTLPAELVQRLLDNGLAILILFSIGWFLERRIWPWFTHDYWPQRIRQHEEEVKTLRMISESLVSLKMLSDAADRYHQDNAARVIRIEGAIEAVKVISHSLFQNNEEMLSKFKATDTIIFGSEKPKPPKKRPPRKTEVKATQIVRKVTNDAE